MAGDNSGNSGKAGTALFDLTGKVAAVIGGAGVLGGAVCHGFGRAGATVAVMDRSRERADVLVAALKAEGTRAAALALDASDKASVERARVEVEKLLGPVDILVNAVGINSSTPFFELDLEEWHRVLDTNLTSALIACQVFGRAMVDRGQGGTIINFSSASSEIPLSRVLTYSVSKAGVNILTLSLADTQQFGILRLIVRDWERAKSVLERIGCIVNVTEVVAIEVEDRPGGLAAALEPIDRLGINVEYMYAIAGRDAARKATLVFRFSDTDAAIEALAREGVNLMGGAGLLGRLEQ